MRVETCKRTARRRGAGIQRKSTPAMLNHGLRGDDETLFNGLFSNFENQSISPRNTCVRIARKITSRFCRPSPVRARIYGEVILRPILMCTAFAVADSSLLAHWLVCVK